MKDKEKELGEKIFIMGSEDDERRAAKMCSEISDDQDQIRQDWQDRWLTILDGRKFKKIEYNLAMRTLLLSLVGNIDFPPGFNVDVLATQEGVILKMTTPTKRIFAQGVESVGTPKYDFQAMLTVAIRLENTLDRLTAKDEDSKISGTQLIRPGSKDYGDITDSLNNPYGK